MLRTTEMLIKVGSGSPVKQRRALGDFSKVKIASQAKVSLSFGDDSYVEVEIDDNLKDLIKTKVTDGVLTIDGVDFFHSGAVPVLTIVTRQVDSVAFAGAGSLTIDGFQGDAFALNIMGSCDVNVTGQCRQEKVIVNGLGGFIDLSDLEASNAVLSINGTCTAQVNVTDSLDVTINGSAIVKYQGNPRNLVKKINGSGVLERM